MQRCKGIRFVSWACWPLETISSGAKRARKVCSSCPHAIYIPTYSVTSICLCCSSYHSLDTYPSGVIQCLIAAMIQHSDDENVNLHVCTAVTNFSHNSWENRSR